MGVGVRARVRGLVQQRPVAAAAADDTAPHSRGRREAAALRERARERTENEAAPALVAVSVCCLEAGGSRENEESRATRAEDKFTFTSTKQTLKAVTGLFKGLFR